MSRDMGTRWGAAAALSAACLAGCFTEVGNPTEEQSVRAEFSIDYSRDPSPLPKAAATASSGDSVLIQQFWLSVNEAEYRTYDSSLDAFVEKHLWKEDSAGISADFTGRDSVTSLPTRMVPRTPPTSLKLDCHLPSAATLEPDTLDFDAFPNRGFIKGLVGSMRFLFALPAAHEMHLNYSQAALETFRSGNEYDCRFVFFATKWMAGQSLAKARTWNDRMGNPVAVFDSTHNAVEYQALTDSFYKSFNASSAGAGE